MCGVLLNAGAQLTVHDVNTAAVTNAVERGATPAATAAEACRGASVLFVMVATPQQLEDVLFGDHGAAQTLGPGDVVVVKATVGPAAIESAAQRLLQEGVLTVDAPVSGGVSRAGVGDLLIMVSGPPDAVTVTRPLLQLLARDLHEFGDTVGGPDPGGVRRAGASRRPGCAASRSGHPHGALPCRLLQPALSERP
jgi:3-hydroxyisobutyrate dehydrogenase-like beta-hydroxyacid dehydrogenase